ncbi:MAG: terminase small subunit [Gammaproteobacteria bacterium]|jgi:phage terminase Nu1 subunit (DNA packaging protein)
MKGNLQEAAVILGVSLTTMRKYVLDGMPYEQKGTQGKQWVLNIPDCVQWAKNQAVANAVGDVAQADMEELKKRKLAADTTVAEVEAAKKRGEVIYIEDAVKIRTAEVLAAKARLLSIPARIDHVVAGSTDRRFCRQVITDELYGALEELATGSIDVEAVFPEV